jgi:hypothetical protein
MAQMYRGPRWLERYYGILLWVVIIIAAVSLVVWMMGK